MSTTTNTPTNLAPLGVAKVVKLGAETLLVIEITNGTDVVEGEYSIKAIQANPKGVTGATSCGIQVIVG